MVRVEYIVCPLCARTRTIETARKGTVKWDFVDVANANLLQVREGGGKKAGLGGRGYRGSAKGSGFHLVEAKTLEEMLSEGTHADVLEGMKKQLIRLVKDSIELGWIKKEELT